MNKILTGCLMTLAFCCGSANASLISVEFDDFTLGNPSGEVFNSSGLSVTRTGPTETPQFFGNKFSLNQSHNNLSLIYDVGAISDGLVSFGNFGDVYATSGASGSQFDGFMIDVSFAFSGTATVSFLAGPDGTSYDLNPGINVFRNVASPSDTSVKFYFQYTEALDGFSGSMTIHSISAVPEPSSLLLAGTALVGLCSFRRRKSV